MLSKLAHFNASSAAASKSFTNALSTYPDGLRLLADVGGTNARFALESRPGVLESVRTYPCKDYSGLQEVIEHYMVDAQCDCPQNAAIAIANPVDGDQIKMTNHHWQFSIEGMRRALGLITLVVVNDFTALAMALPKMNFEHWRQIGGGTPRQNSPIALLGPGTGLGVSGLIYDGKGWVPLSSEGGHVTFSPVDERDNVVLQYARRLWAHVSFERIAAGPGLSVIYDALATARGRKAPGLSPGNVVALAMKADQLANEAVSCFCAILGTLAGNLALTLGAKGGVYVGGGVTRKLDELFDAEAFRQRFEQKGRFAPLMKAVPTYQITAEYPAFLGIAAILADRLGN